MDITYLVPREEVNILEQIKKNHKDYSTRQRASLVLMGLVDRSFASGRPYAPFGLTVLIERYQQYGFSCLLPNWDPKYIHSMAGFESSISGSSVAL